MASPFQCFLAFKIYWTKLIHFSELPVLTLRSSHEQTIEKSKLEHTASSYKLAVDLLANPLTVQSW